MGLTGDADFAQFHSISVLVGDTTPPMLDVLQKVDPTFREIPHIGNDKISTKFRNAERFDVEFLVPNRGSDDFQGKPTKMPALGGAGAEPLRFLDYLIYHPVRSVLLHRAGIVVSVPAPERYAVHKLIVATQRKDNDNGRLKATKDVMQAGAIIEALKLEGRGIDVGFAWMEAWDRGERWKEVLRIGVKRLAMKERNILKGLVAEASETARKNPANYAITEDDALPSLPDCT
jgi:hypothetical protein